MKYKIIKLFGHLIILPLSRMSREIKGKLWNQQNRHQVDYGDKRRYESAPNHNEYFTGKTEQLRILKDKHTKLKTKLNKQKQEE